MTDKIRIAIGSEPKTFIPLQVLKHSILKHSSSPENIEFIDLHGTHWTSLKESRLGVGTGFSLHRWFIPELCNFSGKAIYLDVDMLCFADIQSLLELMPDNCKSSIACTYQKDKWFDKAPATSMMLIDCDKAKTQWQYSTQEQIVKYLEADVKRKRYIQLMHAQLVSIPPLEIPIDWNCFNKPSKNCKILHYTVEPDQPWYSPNHPYKDLWRDYFVETLKAGLITKEDFEKELKRYKPPKACEGCRAEGIHKYWSKFLVHCVV